MSFWSIYGRKGHFAVGSVESRGLDKVNSRETYEVTLKKVDHDRLLAPTQCDLVTFNISSRLENVLLCSTKRQVSQGKGYA